MAGRPQDNRWEATFADLFIKRRLQPQLEALIAQRKGGDEGDEAIERLKDRTLAAADEMLRCGRTRGVKTCENG